MRKTIICTFLCLIWASTAHAMHPLLTDDTGTQGTGRLLLEMNGEYGSHTEGIRKTEEAKAAASLSYGVKEHMDVVATMPAQWLRIKENGMVTSDMSGAGDTSLEIKYRIFEVRDRGVSIAIKPGVSFPSGNEARGFGTGNMSETIVLISTIEGKFGAIHANFGHTHNTYRLAEDKISLTKGIWHTSLAGVLNLSTRLRSVANIGIETNAEKTASTNPSFLIAGVVYSITNALDIDVGIKQGLNSPASHVTLMGGVSLNL